ncbi:hypothetical protein ACLB2K_035052 [Fragaria x ananassa]
MVIMGKRKGRATKANDLMESIRQSVGSASSSSHPNPMPAEIVPPGGPPLIVRRPIVDSCSTGSQSAFVTATETATAPEAARRIVGSAQIKLRPRKRGGIFVLERRWRISFNKTGQNKLEYCPRVKGPSVRGINSLVAHDIGCAIRSLVGMRASTFYDLGQTEKWKVWNAMSAMFNWILMRAQERYKDWKYQCHKAYLKEGSSGMPSDFIGREDRWDFLCQHFESDAFKKLSLANKRNREEKTMHHHTGSSSIIYTMEEFRIQGEQLPIIKGFEKTYVRAGDEDTTKKYQLQEVQQCYEQRLKESEDRAQEQLIEVQRRAQQQFQEVHQHALRAESMYSVV